MEVVYNLENNNIIVKPNQAINFDNGIKSQKIFFVLFDGIFIANPYLSHNATLYKVEKEILKYVEPIYFEYENEGNISELYFIPLKTIIFYLCLIFFI